MKNIFDPICMEETLQRIERLHTLSQPQWGKWMLLKC